MALTEASTKKVSNYFSKANNFIWILFLGIVLSGTSSISSREGAAVCTLPGIGMPSPAVPLAADHVGLAVPVLPAVPLPLPAGLLLAAGLLGCGVNQAAVGFRICSRMPVLAVVFPTDVARLAVGVCVTVALALGTTVTLRIIYQHRLMFQKELHIHSVQL